MPNAVLMHRSSGLSQKFTDSQAVEVTSAGGMYAQQIYIVANEQGNNQQQIAKAGTTPDWGPRAN